MKKKILVKIGMAPMLVLFLLSCGQGEAMPQQTEIPSETVAETPEPTPASPGTPEELRRAIAQAGPGESDLKREYYEQLLSMDAFEEADYAALAGVYGELGEKALQRDMLEKALRLYPSREYAGQVSAIVVETDDSDARMAAMAARILEALGGGDAAALREITGGEEWQELLQGGMTGVETRTSYHEGENVLQILADGGHTEITWLGAEGRFCFYEGDETGVLLGEAVLKDGVYSGAVTVSRMDPEGNLLHAYSGTLQKDICVDQITVEYQGNIYTGKLNADGTTAEEQYGKVADAGGVVYAYTADGRSYLYEADTAPEAFVMDAAYLGFPEYTEWR